MQGFLRFKQGNIGKMFNILHCNLLSIIQISYGIIFIHSEILTNL